MARVLRLVPAFVAGSAVGSLPLSGLVGRLAGIDVSREGEGNPGSATVWKLAGPGPGAIALSAAIAKGLLPTAAGVVGGGFPVGWAAGLGAVVGHGWPAFGRLPGGRAVATAGGGLIGLGPSAAVVAVPVGAVALGVRGRVAGIVAAFVAYPAAFLAIERDPSRFAATMTLYLVTLVRYVSSRRKDGRGGAGAPRR